MSSEDLWSEEELKASVDRYAEMYKADREGRRVNKAQIYRELEAQFGRRNKAFERRMMNISDVVAEMGGIPVKGLLPAEHIGLNTRAILERLVKEAGFLDEADSIHIDTSPAVTLDQLDQSAEQKQEEWKKLGKKVLPPKGYSKAETYKSESTQRKRSPDVKAWVLHQAKGVCELCDQKAPFMNQEGTPYLEVHHVVQLADDGPDTTENAVAVCPNCHRALHLAHDRNKLIDNLYLKVSRLIKS